MMRIDKADARKGVRYQGVRIQPYASPEHGGLSDTGAER